eukprot:1485511-Rhodomonas_salina.1
MEIGQDRLCSFLFLFVFVFLLVLVRSLSLFLILSSSSQNPLPLNPLTSSSPPQVQRRASALALASLTVYLKVQPDRRTPHRSRTHTTHPITQTPIPSLQTLVPACGVSGVGSGVV